MCNSPLVAMKLENVYTKSGKNKVVVLGGLAAREHLEFGDSSQLNTPFLIPCGKCVSCRIKHSREWAVRCCHEASLYEKNCFITLTYNNEHLPSDKSLHLEHWQKFMKRFRKKYGEGIRFFMCGEYGSVNARPHYHACIFGFDFPDKEIWQVREKIPLYRSHSLEKLWPFGFSTIGEVTFESAAYVARYIFKKITGDKAAEHYNGRKPEFITMSRRPGIAHDWFLKNERDIYSNDFLIDQKKHKIRPLRYYDHLMEIYSPDEYYILKKQRLENLSKIDSFQRMQDKEKFKKYQLKKLVRPL
ncbi:replication initiation protein [Tortoise microvirus 50]|nr:replication initiation protein [Tortoise microvirus 50]